MDDPILEYKILDTVHRSDGKATQSHISKKIGRSVASVNFGIRMLAVKGFIKISGAGRRNLAYHLTPRGVVQKTALAYNFLKRQTTLYQDVRENLLGQLQSLKDEGVRKVSVYGWTPFSESAVLFLISEGVEVTALYVNSREAMPLSHSNRIPVKLIAEFEKDSEVIVLLEPLPEELDNNKLGIQKLDGTVHMSLS
jgi:DNA-binding Lrp family transcriptional regulator